MKMVEEQNVHFFIPSKDSFLSLMFYSLSYVYPYTLIISDDHECFNLVHFHELCKLVFYGNKLPLYYNYNTVTIYTGS